MIKTINLPPLTFGLASQLTPGSETCPAQLLCRARSPPGKAYYLCSLRQLSQIKGGLYSPWTCTGAVDVRPAEVSEMVVESEVELR